MEIIFLKGNTMKFLKKALKKYFFPSFLQEKPIGFSDMHVDSCEYVELSPAQFQNFTSIKRYSSEQQAKDILDLYEITNRENPIDPKRCYRVAKRDMKIIPPRFETDIRPR